MDTQTQSMEELNQLLNQETQKGTVGAGTTDVFSAAAAKPETQKMTSEEAIREIFSGMTEAATNGAIVNVDSPKGRLMQVMDEKGAICGFVTPKGNKISLSSAKISSESDARTIRVVDRMASKILGVIIKYPKALEDAINKCNAVAGYEPNYPYENGSPEDFKDATDGMVVKIFDYDSAVTWISKHCFQRISEARAIFRATPRKDKSGKWVTKKASEVEAYYFLKSKVTELLAQANTPGSGEELVKKQNKFKNLRGSQLAPLKCSYRSKLLTQGNYIALAKYVTEPVKPKYSAEEAELRNKYMVLPLISKKKVIDNVKYGQLDENSRQLIQVVNGTVTSQLFNTTGESALLKMQVASWYDPTAIIKGSELQLPVITEKEGLDKDKNVVKRKVMPVVELGAPDAEGRITYFFDPKGEHANIGAACGFDSNGNCALTASAIADFQKELKNAKKSSGKGNLMVRGVNIEVLLQGLINRGIQG